MKHLPGMPGPRHILSQSNSPKPNLIDSQCLLMDFAILKAFRKSPGYLLLKDLQEFPLIPKCFS